MENRIYRLRNQIKHYEWGSSYLIPQFLGIENSRGIPYAEMWMGTHSFCPSMVDNDDALIDLVKFSGELPFLFKLIAVQKPLSVQAHPNKAHAEKGFDREEKQGLSMKNPIRNYRDKNHKPEILCALSNFTLMAGFREPDGIRVCLEAFMYMAPPLKEIISPLLRALANGSLFEFFRILSGFSRLEREYLCAFILEKGPGDSGGAISPHQWDLMKSLAAQFPGDTAVISPLYLNLVTLKPGQAVFIPVGTLHAYLSGFGVELMANSDNVLRGGLTPKHIDIDELMDILYFVPFVPQIVTCPVSAPWFCYHTPCSDFLLALMRGGAETVFPGKGQAICLVTEGELNACGMTFRKGESFFISAGDKAPVLFDGNYSLFAASAGDENTDSAVL